MKNAVRTLLIRWRRRAYAQPLSFATLGIICITFYLLRIAERNYWHTLVGAMMMLTVLIVLGWVLAHIAIVHTLNKLLRLIHRVNAGDFSVNAELFELAGELGEGIGMLAAELERATMKLKALNSQAQNRNQLLASALRQEPLEELLVRIIDMTESQLPSAVCSIALFDEATQSLHAEIAPNLPDSYIRAVAEQSVGPQSGSFGTAVYTRQPVIVENIATDARWVRHRELAMNYGLCACWSQPMIAASGKVLGVFGIYFWAPRPFDQRIAELLQIGASLAAATVEFNAMRTAIADSAKQNRDLFENNPNPMWIFDIETLRMLKANSAAAKQYGYELEDFCKLSLRELIPEQDWPTLDAVYMRWIRSNDVKQLRVRHCNRIGGLLYVDVIATPILFEGHRARFVVAHDMTETVRTAHDFVVQHKQIDALLESTTEGIYGTDSEGRISFINRACVQALGYSNANELVGKSAHELLHRNSQQCMDHAEQNTCSLYQAMSTKNFAQIDRQILWRKDGQSISVDMRIHPMAGNDTEDGVVVAFNTSGIGARLH